MPHPDPTGDPRPQPRFTKPQASGQVPAAGSVGGKRFLGGTRLRQAGGDWYRLFMTASALLMTLILLGVSLWYLFGTKYRPLLIVVAVTDYESDLVPPIAFASQDAQEIRRTTRMTQTDPGLTTAGGPRQTRRDFEQLFARDLPSLQNDTVVLYLTAHGVSGPQGGYLLHSEVLPDQPGNGYPLEYVLQQLAACPARNKLLILDTARLDGNLELGLLGNDFALHLKREMQQLHDRLAAESADVKQNLWVLCSGGAGQTAWTSNRIGLSVFGAAVAYALHGGPEVERRGAAARRDGVLSAREIADYVEQCVASWSLHYRGSLQRPFHIAIGDDFPIVPVDSGLSADRFFAQRVALWDLGKLPEVEHNENGGNGENGGNAGTGAGDENGAAEQQTAGNGASGANGANNGQAAGGLEKTAGKSAGNANTGGDATANASATSSQSKPPSTEDLLAQAQQFWRQRAELAAGRTVFERSRHWSLFQHELLRAEQFVFAGDLRTADRLLNRTIPALAAVLTAPVERTTPPAWSLANVTESFGNPQAGAAASQQTAHSGNATEPPANAQSPAADPAKLRDQLQAQLAQAVAEPTKENLDALRDSPLVEAALLRLLAQRVRDGDQWLVPAEAIRFALDTRTLGEQAARPPSPDVIVFVHETIARADQHRRRGERALLVGRATEARAELKLARGDYERAAAEARIVDRRLHAVKHMVLDAYSLIRWLAAAPDDWPRKPDTLSRLDEFFRELDELRTGPTQDRLRRLAELADDLRQRTGDYAQNAWQRDGLQPTLAALELSSLAPELRQRLLDRVVHDPEGDVLRPSGRRHAVPRYDRPANPYPLADLVARLGGSEPLVNGLRRLDPGRPDPVLLQDVLAGRADRSTAGLELRRFLQQLRAKSTEEPPGASAWEQSLVHLLRAPLQAPAARGTRFEDSISMTLAKRMQARQLRWQLNRLLEDRANLPGEYDDAAVPEITAALHSLDPDAAPQSIGTVFTLAGEATLEIPAEASSEIPLELRAARGLAPGETADLVLDWYADRTHWEMTIAPAPPAGQVFNLSPNTPWPTLPASVQTASSATPWPRLPASVHTASSVIPWPRLPVSVQTAPRATPWPTLPASAQTSRQSSASPVLQASAQSSSAFPASPAPPASARMLAASATRDAADWNARMLAASATRDTADWNARMLAASATNESGPVLPGAKDPPTAPGNEAADEPPGAPQPPADPPVSQHRLGQGRLRIPLSNVTAGDIIRVQLQLRPADAVAVARPPRLSAWVELSSGSVDWLPVRIEPPRSKAAPAELVLKRRERTGDPNTVDLYPNQQAPLQVFVRKNAPAAMNLRVEFDGGRSAPAAVPLATADMQTGLIPVLPEKDLNLKIGDGRLTVRLYRGDDLLDEQRLGVAVLEPAAYVRPQVTYDAQQRRVVARIRRIANSDSDQPTSFELALPGMTLEEGNLAADLPADEDEVVLSAVVPPTADDRSLEAVVSASGVPRSFFYQVGARQPAGRHIGPLSLRIVSPPPRTVYLADPKGGELPIGVQVDGPPELQVYAGPDRNGNGVLDVDERRAGGRFWSGRQVNVALKSAADAPGFVVESQVGDVALTLDATGMVGRQRILVQLSAGNQTLTEELPVYYVTAAPEIVLDQPAPGAQFAVGRPIRVTVRCPGSLYGAVDRVEFAVDKNGNGAWDDDETLAPIGSVPEQPLRFDHDNRLEASLPSTGLTPPETILLRTPDSEVTTLERTGGASAPQTVTLMARAVVRVVNPPAEGGAELKGPIARQTIVLTPAGEASEPPGRVAGTVVALDGSGQKGAFVSIEGVGRVQTGPGGTFRFTQVPPGDHQVTASTRTGRRTGTAPVQVKSDEETPVRITVLLKSP